MGNASKYNLQNFYNILKNEAPLYSYQFIAEFNININLAQKLLINTPSIDGFNKLSYFVSSATIPGVTLKNANVAYLGTQFNLPGVISFSHNWSCSFVLTQDLAIYKIFRRWQDHISSLALDGGGNKGIDDSKVKLYILDKNGETTTTKEAIVLEGLWCQHVTDITGLQYQNGGGNAIESFNVDFKYQYSYIEKY